MRRSEPARWMSLMMLCGALALSGVATAAIQGTTNPASTLKDRIVQAIASVQSRIDASTDVSKLNCLNTEKANLETYLTDAQGIEGAIQAAIDGQNEDQVERENQKIVPLETNVNSAIERANSCKGAADLGDGTTMSVTVTGGNSNDEGDESFGASPSGSTRTAEASSRN
jgi:hypothetical protein